MITRRKSTRRPGTAALFVLALLGLAACITKTEPMSQLELNDFATRYAAAWSGQHPVDLASFYAEDGSLAVNGGSPSVGRVAIAAKAREFMDAFPDMVVKMDSVSRAGPFASAGTKNGQLVPMA